MKLVVRKKYLFYILVLVSAFITAGTTCLDTVISVNYISDPWAFSLACFLVGIVITAVILLLFSVPLGDKNIGARVIDPSFRGMRMIRKKEIKYHIGAGIGNGLMTLSYMFLLDIFGDPSAVLPFAQITILYLVAIESVTEKNAPTLVEIQSSLIVTMGAILVSMSLTTGVNIQALAVVFLLYNPAWVLFSIYQRKLKLLKVDDHPNDSLNIRLWNLIFSAIAVSVIIIAWDIIGGETHFIDGILASVTQFRWVALTMALAFFSVVLYIRALGIGKASVTQAVKSSSVFFAIPFTIILAYFGFIPSLPSDPVSIMIKGIGIILVVLGIVSFALHMVKAYIFIDVKRGSDLEETMEKIWKIRGVSRVAAVAGVYDFIVEVRIRDLVKGYERIIRKLEAIPQVYKCRWQSILKEWDEL